MKEGCIRLDRPIAVPINLLPTRRGILYLERSSDWPQETVGELFEYIGAQGGIAQMSVHVLSAIYLICDDLKALGVDTSAVDRELIKYKPPSQITQWNHRSFVLPSIYAKFLIDDLSNLSTQTIKKIDDLILLVKDEVDFPVWLFYHKFRMQILLKLPLFEKWEYVDYDIAKDRVWPRGLAPFFRARYRDNMHEDPPFATAFALAAKGLGYDTDWALVVINEDDEVPVEMDFQAKCELYMANDQYHNRAFLEGLTIANLPRTLQGHFGTCAALHYTRFFIEAKLFLEERGPGPHFEQIGLIDLGDWPENVAAFFTRVFEQERDDEQKLAIVLAQKAAGVDPPELFHQYSDLVRTIEWEGSFFNPTLTMEENTSDRFLKTFNGDASFTAEELEKWDVGNLPENVRGDLDTRLACRIAQLFIRSWIEHTSPFRYKIGDGYTWPDKAKAYILDLQIEDSEPEDLLARYFILQHFHCNGEIDPLKQSLQGQDLSLPDHIEFPFEYSDLHKATLNPAQPNRTYTFLVQSLQKDTLTFHQKVAIYYWKYYVAQQITEKDR